MLLFYLWLTVLVVGVLVLLYGLLSGRSGILLFGMALISLAAVGLEALQNWTNAIYLCGFMGIILVIHFFSNRNT